MLKTLWNGWTSHLAASLIADTIPFEVLAPSRWITMPATTSTTATVVAARTSLASEYIGTPFVVARATRSFGGATKAGAVAQNENHSHSYVRLRCRASVAPPPASCPPGRRLRLLHHCIERAPARSGRRELLGQHRRAARRQPRGGHEPDPQPGHRPARLRAHASRRSLARRSPARAGERRGLRPVGAQADRRESGKRPPRD